VRVTRRVEWVDTDAAGHHHHGAVLRWVEAAETELLRSLGVEGLFGRIPRVRYEVDYSARLWFGQDVEISVEIVHVGRTSLRYAFEVAAGDVTAATGQLVIVYAEPDSPGAVPWPADIRAKLTSRRRDQAL
jgi:acyl-CoA thioester hydrolase